MTRILITGAGGLLGQALQSELPKFDFTVLALTHGALDITDTVQVSAAVAEHRPDIVINCAAYTRVDDAELNEEAAHHVNAHGARVVAETCARGGIRIVYPSTDYVFDGHGDSPWRTNDPIRPINAYGRSKAAGEVATALAPDYLVVRTSWLFGGGGRNFVRTIADRLQRGEPSQVVNDQTGRPTYARDLARALACLLGQKAPSGIYHLANSGQATWFEFAREIAGLVEGTAPISACMTADLPKPTARPRFSVLETGKADAVVGRLRNWREALGDAVQAQDY